MRLGLMSGSDLLISKDVARILWDGKVYFSQGKRGLIYVSFFDEKKFVIKSKNPKSTSSNVILREYDNNLFLNNLGVGPKVFFYDEELDFVVREFVDGVNFFEWVKTLESKIKLKKFFLNLLDQCRKMDVANLNKLEMNHPHKDLLVVDDLPVIIDFERCKRTLRPKNVTQLCQFFVSGNVEVVLKSFGCSFNDEKILSLAENYKKFMNSGADKDFFEKIKKEIDAL
jgi:predicted Ser/Thr protein kinase